MRIWPWRWHHGNSMKFQGLKSKAMAEVKSNHHPKPTKPCKIPWDHFKMYGKVDHKMCRAPQRQAFFFKNLLNRQHGFPPAGMFLEYSSVPRCGIVRGGHFEHVSLPAQFLAGGILIQQCHVGKRRAWMTVCCRMQSEAK